MNEQTQRIIRIMEDKKMTPTQFSEAIGIQRAAMSHITQGRNNPSADVITKVIERFDDIDPGWLLTGKGMMKLVLPDGSDNSKEQNLPLAKPVNEIENVMPKPVLHSREEKDLFSGTGTTAYTWKNQPNTPPVEAIRTDIHPVSENRKAEVVNEAENSSKTIEKEVVIYKERADKSIEKIIIYFSDHTYETFLPEKK